MVQLVELAQQVRQVLTPEDLRGATDLLVLQGTPFCNLDCAYCYLPNRADRRRMRLETVVGAVRWLMREGLAADEVTILWHAGEPLILPRDWYEAAFRATAEAAGSSCRITHALQTNATLVTDAWCDLFLREGARVGVSIDGPAEMHDRYRKTRRGGGSHAATMRGLERLRRRGVPLHVIAVVTEHTAKAGDAFIDFMEALGIQELGINFEEVEGANRQTSLDSVGVSSEMRAFLERLVDRAATSPRLRLREARHLRAMLRDPLFGQRERNVENGPFRIVTVDTEGGFYTYSPELAGVSSGPYANFRLGFVQRDRLRDILRREPFLSMERDIVRGVRRCRRQCAYFGLCVGGAPSNKIAEHGRFDATETIACRHSVKAMSEALLRRLERDLAAPKAADGSSAGGEGDAVPAGRPLDIGRDALADLKEGSFAVSAMQRTM